MTFSDTQFRAAQDHDVVALAKLYLAARETAMPWLPNLHSHAEDIAFFSERVLPVLRVEVAERDGQIAGFIATHDDWIDQLYIHPRFWRQGLGRALLNRAMHRAQFRQLWVFKQNHAAQDFYARRGFVAVEHTDGSENAERCPDVRMEWRA
jgi:GNAT superfamily N-acetyltransferase